MAGKRPHPPGSGPQGPGRLRPRLLAVGRRRQPDRGFGPQRLPASPGPSSGAIDLARSGRASERDRGARAADPGHDRIRRKGPSRRPPCG
ncbi:MAG: hypothetical protein MZV64_64600 [Ignavibacteriales bacterium]|nr:hypothetical protein [Ignavibacteriales bacterium]